MIVEADFVTHWKTNALSNAIGDAQAFRAILKLWAHCQTRRAWEFRLSPLMLAGICGYTGKADDLWKAMVELRFLDQGEEEGWWQVHDWGQVNAGLAGQWAGGAKVKGATWHPQGYAVLPDESTSGDTNGNTSGATNGSSSRKTSRSTTGATPRLTGGDTDRMGLDRNREDRISTPKAPKGADTHPFPENWSEGRKATMQRWLDYKAEHRKTYKPSSWQALLGKLDILPDENLEVCVTESIAQGWQGLFPERFTLLPPTRQPGDLEKSQKKEGAGPGGIFPPKKKVPPADFPWRDVAVSVEGWTPEGEWEDQTPRTRQTLRETWAGLSAQGKSAIWALAPGAQGEEPQEEVTEGDA